MQTTYPSPVLSSQVDCGAVRDEWNANPFFAPDSVVLGLDIGIEGIGIAVRRGSEWLYAKTLLVDLPQAQALAERRAFRASRHARKNRRTRMCRLKDLFDAHGLPWVNDDQMSRSDPFKLRYRAITGTLASREALSICIRSCVLRRGYDYFAMSGEEGGEMPWGESLSLSDAKKWLASAYVDEKLREQLLKCTPSLTHNNKELDAKKAAEWEELVESRYALADTLGIEATLRDYAHKTLNERKARGRNFPRAHVEAHLRTILQRHAHLIDRPEAFAESLFCDCDTREHKKVAIFHYNRKTPNEAARHFAGKVKQCPYCSWLDLPTARCGMLGDKDIRKWKLLDFVSVRTFEWETKNKLPLGHRTLPAEAVRVLVQAVDEGKKWGEAKKMMDAELKKLQLVMSKREWNVQQSEQLKDIIGSGASLRGRAGMSAAAARAMVDAATAQGADFEPAHIEQWKKDSGLYTFRAQVDVYGGIYPQVQTLMGTLRKQKAGEERTFACKGFLQHLFERTLRDKLGGKLVPDYCVIECIKNPAINSDKAKEIEKKQKENRARREKLAASFEKSGNASHADFLRMRLFSEQGGSPTTPATCPFTGQKLAPEDLFTAKFQLAHLWPDSRGGLYMADNLVLTTREVNAAMQNMTPREAAAASLPGWLSWEEMRKLVSSFGWGKDKREIFSAEEFPEFNNMTRTAQLARELRRLVAVWMGISANPEDMRLRIGNPCGVYTAAARRCFMAPEYRKDRSDNTHHRIDAALMTCLPPSGMNDVLYRGIFHTVQNEKGNRELMCLEGLHVPDIMPLLQNGAECPVVKINSRSKCKSLGDSTFWAAKKDGLTHQRTPLNPANISNAKELVDILVRMGIPAKDIPAEKLIDKWLESAQAATKADVAAPKQLCLNNGTPIRSIWKFGSKGNLDKSPLGWNGMIAGDGTFTQLRSLSASNDRMELWLGWNANKKCWEYYKKLIPTAAAMAGIKRMGLPWRGTKGAPPYLLELLARRKAKDLHKMVCGALPPGAVKLASFRKGDVFRLIYEADPKYLEKLQKEGRNVEDLKFSVETWGTVTAVKSDMRLETKSLVLKGRKDRKIASVSDLAEFAGFPANPAELAAARKLNPPS